MVKDKLVSYLQARLRAETYGSWSGVDDNAVHKVELPTEGSKKKDQPRKGEKQ